MNKNKEIKNIFYFLYFYIIKSIIGDAMNQFKAKLKEECHFYFDKLWTTPEERRSLYRWLSNKMHKPLRLTHFSSMSEKDLYKARRIIKKEFYMSKGCKSKKH
jgi:hypothetical protein